MAHALATHAREGDFDTALFADDALILHALIFAAQAFIILDRPKDARAEQTIALRLKGAVIDRLWLFDFTERPRKNLFGAGDRNLDLIERLWLSDRIEEIHDLLIHAHLLKLEPSGIRPSVLRWIIKAGWRHASPHT